MTQLSVLDQVPIPRGSSAGTAIRSSIELARHAEELGYGTYWFAEHHLDQGRASSAPPILIALAIEATTRITLGSAATVLPFHTSLDVAEQFGSLAAVAPGRVVLGLGRSKHGYGESAPYREISEILASVTAGPGTQDHTIEVAANGSDFLFELLGYLSHAPLIVPHDESRIREILNYLDHPVAVVGGQEYRVSPGYQEDLGLAVFGGESGYSATIAAKYGLPLYVNAHSIKNDIVGTVERYRQDFAPSKRLAAPYVGVSAHAIAAETAERGRQLEETFLRTLASLRSRGAYLPSEPPSADGFVEPDNAKYADSRALSIAGEASDVVDRLRALSDSVAADELLISTIVYAPEDRRTSYRLIAREMEPNHMKRTPTLLRLSGFSAALGLAAVLTAGPAAAHVRVDEGQLPAQGGYGIVRLIVPTESKQASTTALTVTIPAEVDLSSARTLPIPGWTAAVETEQAGGGQRVTRITWRAADGNAGVKPAEFGEFTFSAGPWPKDTDTVALITDQSYSDGKVVSWNEIAVDANTEPEHPAPVVTLGAAEAGHGDGHGAEPPAGHHSDEVALASAASPADESWFWRATSLVSLLIALGTAGLLVVALRRNRAAGSS